MEEFDNLLDQLYEKHEALQEEKNELEKQKHKLGEYWIDKYFKLESRFDWLTVVLAFSLFFNIVGIILIIMGKFK